MRRGSPLLPARSALFALLCASCATHDQLSAVSPERDAAGQSVLGEVRTHVFQNFPRDKAGPSRFGGQPEGFVGREDLYTPKALVARPSCVPLKADPYRLIAERARKTNIVIINEDHTSPRDRLFIASVLPVLRRQGYSIYAAETFDPAQALRHENVLGFDGWYSNEPTFGNLVRVAKSLGYSLIAYEQTREQRESYFKESGRQPGADEREANQTANLMTAIFSTNPDAKVVIHVGHSHVRERRDLGATDVPWMAERLKAATGRDPLTISQIKCNSPTSVDVVADSVRKPDGSQEVEKQVDLLVGHPPIQFKDGRPAWRQARGDQIVEVPSEFLHMSERVIIEARPWKQILGAVPQDRILLFPGERLLLLLPRGSYRIDAFVENGRVERGPIRVDVK